MARGMLGLPCEVSSLRWKLTSESPASEPDPSEAGEQNSPGGLDPFPPGPLRAPYGLGTGRMNRLADNLQV